MMTEHEKLKLAYGEAIAQLRLHPPLIWTRNNFFLIINSGLLAFATSGVGAKCSEATSPTIVALTGLFLSAIWLWVNWAGQNIQRYWRKVVLRIEAALFSPQEDESLLINGPFTIAQEIAKEGSRHSISITTALLWLSFGSIVCWEYILYMTLSTQKLVCT